MPRPPKAAQDREPGKRDHREVAEGQPPAEHAVAAARPPVTRRMSLGGAAAHDVLVLAMDQFARGIFHMPHRQYAATHNPSALQLEFPSVRGHAASSPHAAAPASYTSPQRFSRPKELFTIGADLLGVAERLRAAPHREYWAAQADAVFN